MSDDSQELKRTLTFALEKYPHQVELVAVEDLLLDAARQSEKRPAYLKIAVTDETVKGMRGRKASPERLLLVRMPRELGRAGGKSHHTSQ